MRENTCLFEQNDSEHLTSVYLKAFTLNILTLASGGGCNPHARSFSEMDAKLRWTAVKFCMAHVTSFAQALTKNSPGQLKLQNYDVIGSTFSDRFFIEIVFSRA